MDGSRVILECLIKEGVDIVFGYPGGAVIPLYDALYDYKDKIKHIRTSHEQGAVHAADGYARNSDRNRMQLMQRAVMLVLQARLVYALQLLALVQQTLLQVLQQLIWILLPWCVLVVKFLHPCLVKILFKK